MSEDRNSASALPTDEDLLARAIAGDAEAYGDLYERHLQSIYRYIYYRVGEVREAEDMTEIVFLKVWEALPRFKTGRASFRTWLYRVAHNLVVDHYRTRKEETSLSEQPEPASSGPSIEQLVADKEQQRELWQAVAQLSDDHREVLMLRFVSELSHAEAAEVLKRSEGAVRVLQHRALKALADELRELSGEDDGS